MKIILFQPKIPQNTGNIIRTCSVTNSKLAVVTPCGFSLSNRQMKRAGLDYLDVEIEKIEDLDSYLQNHTSFYFFSSKVTKLYSDVEYTKDTLLIFGNETSGLTPLFLEKYPDKFVTIPMKKNARCLNLSNSVAIAIYKGLEKQKFIF